MPDTSVVPTREAIYDINRYLSEDPTLRGIFGPDSPFWPTQSTPDTSVPYVRYITRETVDGDSWYMRMGTVSYAIYAFDISVSSHIMNVMIDLLGRGSDSAQELMDWRRTALTWDGNPYPQDYLFHTLDFIGGGNTEPAEEEAGAHIRIATFRYQYSPLRGTSIA